MGLRSEKCSAGETHLLGEEGSTFTNKEHVGELFHDFASEGYRVGEPLEGTDATSGARGTIHDTGVELYFTEEVGKAADANAAICCIQLLWPDALLNSVESAATMHKYVDSITDADVAIFAGDDDHVKDSSCRS
jgi:hypothetical protein